MKNKLINYVCPYIKKKLKCIFLNIFYQLAPNLVYQLAPLMKRIKGLHPGEFSPKNSPHLEKGKLPLKVVLTTLLTLEIV